MIVQVLKSRRFSEDRRSLSAYDLSLIPANQRESVLIRMRKTAGRIGGSEALGTTLFSPSTADFLLLQAGDTVTIENLMADYRAYDSSASWQYVTSRFRYAKQPKVIPHLARDLDSREDPKKGITKSEGEDFAVSVPARSIFSGVIITDLIQSSPAFSVKMKEWAKEAYELRRKDPGRFRQSMQQWWIQYKAAFEREDYQAVEPLKASAAITPVPLQSPAIAVVANPASPPAPVVTATPPHALPDSRAPEITPAPITAATANTVDAQRHSPKWLWIAGVIGLGIVIIGAFLRRRG